MPEDNDFYVVVWEINGEPYHSFIHLNNYEDIYQHMYRVHKVTREQITQIYTRIYVKV